MTAPLTMAPSWISDESEPGIVRRSWWIDEVGPASVSVDRDRGARLASLRIDGIELLTNTRTASPFADGCFAMAPYAGRVADGRFQWEGNDYCLPLCAPPHAAHGVTANATWTMRSPGVFETTLDERWPFGGWARQQVECLSDGLKLSITIGNDERSMPANIGFHPWFRSDVDGTTANLEWPADLVYAEHIPAITSRELIPKGQSSVTWCAPASGIHPKVTWPSWLEVTLESGQARCWVIHEPPGPAICVEPQTAPGNALQAGDADEVAPGHPLLLELYLKFTSLADALPTASGSPSRPLTEITDVKL